MIRLALVILTLVPTLALAVNCKVVGVSDGDTFTCLTMEDEQLKVRLAEIDAPEIGQPWGNKSKQSLSSLIYSEMVRLDLQDTDRYGRAVARVYRIDRVDVNAEQVRSGAAWAYPKYLKDRSLIVLEAEARKLQRGLWSLPVTEQVAPWEWRDARRNGSAATVPKPKAQATFSQFDSDDAAGFNCNTIKWCSQMSGCAEARYQLMECGNPKIDGDGDGVPCEAICR